MFSGSDDRWADNLKDGMVDVFVPTKLPILEGCSLTGGSALLTLKDSEGNEFWLPKADAVVNIRVSNIDDGLYNSYNFFPLLDHCRWSCDVEKGHFVNFTVTILDMDAVKAILATDQQQQEAARAKCKRKRTLEGLRAAGKEAE